MRNLRLLVLMVIAGIFFVAGCASLKETGKKVWGTSMAHLENARSEGRNETFSMNIDVCFEHCVEILNKEGVNVYLKSPDKAYLAAMNFQGFVDTSEVGVFFTRIDDQCTKVEVTSLVPNLTKKAAEIIFSGLRKDIL